MYINCKTFGTHAPKRHTPFPNMAQPLHTQPQLLLPWDAVMQAAEEETCARAWKLSALFSMDAHPKIYDSRMQLLPEYVRGLLLNRFQHMRKKEKTMNLA